MNKGYFHVIAGSLTLFLCVSVQAATSYTYTSIDYPEATATYAYGIDGDNIVGYYKDSNYIAYGFKYDGSSYTALDVDIEGVTVSQTYAYGIDGSNIVGHYFTSATGYHGFQAVVVPLPTSAWMGLALLAGIGGYGVVRRRIRGY